MSLIHIHIYTVYVGWYVCQVFVYNKLVDMFPKHQLFYIIGGFYFLVFSSIACLLADPNIGIRNENQSPQRLIGEEITISGCYSWGRWGRGAHSLVACPSPSDDRDTWDCASPVDPKKIYCLAPLVNMHVPYKIIPPRTMVFGGQLCANNQSVAMLCAAG